MYLKEFRHGEEERERERRMDFVLEPTFAKVPAP